MRRTPGSGTARTAGPSAAAGEAPAFYRVLLGHQHRGGVAELQVGGGERVVIGKRMRHGHHAMLREMQEEPLGVADARNGMHAFPGEARELAPLARVGGAMSLIAASRMAKPFTLSVPCATTASTVHSRVRGSRKGRQAA